MNRTKVIMPTITSNSFQLNSRKKSFDTDDLSSELTKTSLEDIWLRVPEFAPKITRTPIRLSSLISQDHLEKQVSNSLKKYKELINSKTELAQSISRDIAFSFWVNQSIHSLDCTHEQN